VVLSAGSHFGVNVDILIDGFVPPSTSVAPMFPFFESTAEWDDFGEVINPDDYMMKQEEMDNALMHVSLLPRPLFLSNLISLKF
jgi:cleavage and polyadenylation specificity factor subunit 2